MKRKQGISLIVLVITIIVMIILAAAVVLTLSNTGIIGKASDAVRKSDIKQVENLASLVWSEEYLEGKRGDTLKNDVLERLKDYTDDYKITVTDKGVTVGEYVPEPGEWRIEREYNEEGLITKAVITNDVDTFEIGTEVNYMPEGVGPADAKYTGGWKLLGVDDDGRLLLMAATKMNETGVVLDNVDGFLNGVTKLNEAAAPYKDGVIGVEARSVTPEDIDKVTGYDPSTFTGKELIETQAKIYFLQERAIGNYPPDYEPTEEEWQQIIDFMGNEIFCLSEEEYAILDHNIELTYYWNGTDRPHFELEKNGQIVTGLMTNGWHSTKGFLYYDANTNTVKLQPFVDSGTSALKIATLKTDSYSYDGIFKYVQNCKAYQMIFDKVSFEDNTMEGGGSYLLARRSISPIAGCVCYGLYEVYGSSLGATTLFMSADGEAAFDEPNSTEAKPFRAVVTLADGITLKESTTNPGTYEIVK